MSKIKVKFIAAASFPPFFRGEDVGDTAIVNEELAADLKDAGLVDFVADEEVVEEKPQSKTKKP